MPILPSLRDSWIMHKKVYIGSICSPHISRDWFHKAGLPLAVLIKTWPKQEIKHMWLPNTLTLGQKSLLVPILGDPEAVSGGGEKSKRARKKFGRRKDFPAPINCPWVSEDGASWTWHTICGFWFYSWIFWADRWIQPLILADRRI